MESTAEMIEPLGSATYSPDDNKLRLYAVDRLDEETYQRVKDAGFRWAPKQELFVAPGWTPGREDLLIELCGEIGDEDTTLVERAEVRADRFEVYSTKRAADGDAAHAAVSEIADCIPMGQPILVGHHSERRARRDADKIENGMRRAIQLFDTSQYWAARASGAISSAKYKQLPCVRAKRIKRLEAEHRKLVREYTPAKPRHEIMQEVDGGEAPFVWCGAGRGGQWVLVSRLPAIEARCSRWIGHLDNRLAYEKAMLEAEGATALLDKPKRPKLPPILNYQAEVLAFRNPFQRGETDSHRQVGITKAQLKRVPSDYKGTRTTPDGSHRFRIASGRYFGEGGKHGHDWVAVFLTDSKVHPCPDAGPTQAPETRTPQPTRTHRPEPTESQEKVAGLRKALQSGVQVVSAPQLFETPDPVIVRVMDAAEIERGHSVLEPSAGTGRLARAAFERSGTTTVCVEVNHGLAQMLRARHFDVHYIDFMDFAYPDGRTFDRIVMNPPFAKGADREHVRHAFGLLKAGGRLVAIMSEGPFFREARADVDFRVWLDSVDGLSEKLPPDSFKESGTGVNTRIVVIDR